MNFSKVKLEIFVPKQYVSLLAESVSQAGAGRVGNYDHCLSITEVTGYWRPLPGANPYQGEVGKVSSGKECKLELQCNYQLLDQVMSAIKAAHPYEEPLINIIPLVDKALST